MVHNVLNVIFNRKYMFLWYFCAFVVIFVIFYHHLNIISKIITRKFVTELVEIVHFFSIVTNFSVQVMQS